MLTAFGAAVFALGASVLTDDLSCTILTSFGDDDPNRWVTVNDNVMGGRSLGGSQVIDGQLVFGGSTNTNGGGFSSIRMPLDQGVLAGAKTLRITAQGDGRKYRVTLQTTARYRGRPIAFRQDIAGLSKDAMQTVDVPLTNLDASIFGQSIDGVTFEASDAQILGLIIYDGLDGPFRLVVDEIAVCR